MNKKLREQLENTLQDSMNAAEDLGVGTNEHAQAVDDAVKIAKVLIEDEDKEQVRKEDKRLKELELRNKAIGDALKITAEVAVGIIGIAAYNVWFKQGLEYERDGVIKSTFCRLLFNGINKKGKV